MNTDRKEELILLGELKNSVEGLGNRIDSLSAGLHKRLERTDANVKDLVEKREADLTKLNEKFAEMDKQVSKNTWIIGIAGSVGFALFFALLQADIL